MIKKSLFLLCLFVFSCCFVGAQTKEDSLIIASINWNIKELGKGIIYKSATVPVLYDVPQSINIIEINSDKYRIGIAAGKTKTLTSEMAKEHQAIAAINGSYFDVEKGNSVCFYKIGKTVIDTTTTREFELRVTGALKEYKGKVKLIPWNKRIEQTYKEDRGIVLASGPLMLKDGEICDFSSCVKAFINNKHPRSAIALNEDGKIILITVDGRFPNEAGGINIPEFAHLLKVLGAKYALNLDGGGSTTLWGDGIILNNPCDNKVYDNKGERKVANALYVYENN